MATTNVSGGPPSVQQTLQTMNQSMGQMMTFIQNKKVLEEQTREFNVGKNLQLYENMATQAGGYAPLAKIMGKQGMADFFKNGGMDSLQANDIAEVMSQIKFTPQQITMETIKSAYEEGPESPNYQRLFLSGEFGGPLGTPDPRVEGLAGAGAKAAEIGKDLLEGFTAKGAPAPATAQETTTTTDDIEPTAIIEGTTTQDVVALKADEAKIEVDTKAKVTGLQSEYWSLMRQADESDAAGKVVGVGMDFRRRATAIQDELKSTFGETVGSTSTLRKGISKVLGEKYNLQGRVSSSGSSYISKFAREPLGGIFPTGFQGDKIPDALNGGIPTTQAEFNKLESTTRRDEANLALAESFKNSGIPDEKRNQVLNLMDGNYTPSPQEAAQMLKNYESRMIQYNAEVRNGNVPPIPAGIRKSNEASYIVSKAFIDDVPMSSVPKEVQTAAGRNMLQNGTTPEVIDKLADDVDLIIAVSKNPALATYFMPKVEANRMKNKQLSQADMRLLANKDITSLNTALGVLNFLRSAMSRSAEGNEMTLIAYKGAEKAWLKVQSTTEPGTAERAQALVDTPIAKQFEDMTAILMGPASGTQAGNNVVQYSNFFERIWNQIPFFNIGGGEIQTLQLIDNIQEPETLDLGASGSVLDELNL